VKGAGPVIGAGATFAGAALGGLLLGIWLSGRTGNQLWVLAGLGGGLAVGGYGAFRLLMRSL
jgi:hypothetical protein